jgi:hypothetical protein
MLVPHQLRPARLVRLSALYVVTVADIMILATVTVTVTNVAGGVATSVAYVVLFVLAATLC